MRWVWQSMRPGRSVASPRSMTCAPAGTAIPEPAPVILSPSTTTVTWLSIFPDFTLSMREARSTMIFGAGLSWAHTQRAKRAKMRTRREPTAQRMAISRAWSSARRNSAPEYLTFARFRRRRRVSASNFVSLGAREVCAFGGIDFDFFAFVDEGRHLHDQAGFRFRRLRYAGRGGALQPGLDFRHGQNYGLGQFDADGFAIEKLHLDLEIGCEVLDGVSENVAGQVSLLVVFRVHEVVVVAVVVEVLHVFLVHVDLLDRVGRAEAVLEHGSGAQVAELGLNEGAQVAGRAVLDAEHGVQIIVVLDDHAGAKLGGRNRHATDNLLNKLRSMGPANRGQATCRRTRGSNTLVYTELAIRPSVRHGSGEIPREALA